jgi:hypothetical protein
MKIQEEQTLPIQNSCSFPVNKGMIYAGVDLHVRQQGFRGRANQNMVDHLSHPGDFQEHRFARSCA